MTTVPIRIHNFYPLSHDLCAATRAGKNTVRSALVESCWHLIRKDQAMRNRYEQIKARAGGKRAIVAVSRKLLLCIRRLLIDNRPYTYDPFIKNPMP